MEYNSKPKKRWLSNVGWARKLSITEAVKRPIVILKELERFTDQVEEPGDMTSICPAISKSVLDENLGRRKPYKALFALVCF